MPSSLRVTTPTPSFVSHANHPHDPGTENQAAHSEPPRGHVHIRCISDKRSEHQEQASDAEKSEDGGSAPAKRTGLSGFLPATS